MTETLAGLEPRRTAATRRARYLLAVLAVVVVAAALIWLVPWSHVKDGTAAFAATQTGGVSALALAMAILLALCALLVRGHIEWLVIGEDNRYSNSKFQMAVWFLTVLSAYVGAVLLRASVLGPRSIGKIGIPNDVLALSGMSALTFGGAKQIVKRRIRAVGGREQLVKPRSRLGARFPQDLVNDDSGHRPDLGDIQMLVVTLIAVLMYLVQASVWLAGDALAATTTLPDVDTTLLGVFGLGQGAYLAKKLAGDTPSSAPGPVLNATPPRPDL